jgi:GNAT superfamily N-acetyltransferase
MELLQMVRRELLLREESPTGAWVEETAGELRRGEKWGAYYPPGVGGGLAFRTERGAESFAHVHVDPGPEPVERAVRLTETLLDEVPSATRSAIVGFTGLTPEEERSLQERLGTRPGSTVIERCAMERPLGANDAGALPSLPKGLSLVPVRGVAVDALADLDRRAFEGTIDELLIGPTLADNRRVLSAMLSGEAGRFLDEASTTLYRPDPPMLVGALLSCERSPRRALYADFLVDPRERGRGHGTFLLRWGFRALWALGYERVRLWVSASNRPARRLYDAVGFTVTSTTILYRWERPDSGPQAHASR